jgi:nicotinate dehydrogenase subunit A
MDGNPVRSCVLPLSAADGRTITTLAGLAEGGRPGRLQQTFIDEQAAQCGYCINGMVMQAADLLKRTPKPSEQQIREGLAMNLCRCGTHQRIVRAVQRASGQAVTA